MLFLLRFLKKRRFYHTNFEKMLELCFFKLEVDNCLIIMNLRLVFLNNLKLLLDLLTVIFLLLVILKYLRSHFIPQ